MRKLPVHLLLAGAVLLAAVVLRVADPEPIAKLRLSIFDSYQRALPHTSHSDEPVRVVDVDEASLQKIGQWPWPRTRLAEIIDNLRRAGAATVALDIILAEPDRLSPEELARHIDATTDLQPLVERVAQMPSNDAKLGAAVGRMPVVLGVSGEVRGTIQPPKPRAGFAFAGDDPTQFAPSFPAGTGPLGVLADRAAGLGAVNWLPSKDQIVRRVPLVITVGGQLYPSLPLEQLRLAQDETTHFVRSSGGHGILSFGQKTGIDAVRTGSFEMPTDGDGQMWLAFRPFDISTYIPAWTVLDGSFDKKEVDGRHIIVGASATGLLDLRATPLDASVPGVEIHAQALNQMLSRVHLERPIWAIGAELSFLVLTGALVAWLIGRVGPALAAALGSGAIALVLVFSWLAYGAGFLFDPIYPSIALVFLYLASSLTKYVATEAERMRVRSAFSHYVAAPLVEELARDPSKLALGGEMRDLTVLFSDIRGFTKISEGMNAEELIGFINGLFTPLSEIILEHEGTIDKFMGDAVMAFWNAPLPDADHAEHACRASLAMMARLDQLNREWLTESSASGAQRSPVRIGIGLNTGSCCAGNVGSPQQLNYSIVGDTVNVAARLEEATKTYGWPILAGESTAKGAPGFAFLEVDSTDLRGKTRTERIFALMGDETVAKSEGFRVLKLTHAAFVSALASGNKDVARDRIADLEGIAWPGLEPLLAHYRTRIGQSS